MANFRCHCRQPGGAAEDGQIRGIERDLTERKGLDLAAYQPGFIIDQIIATARLRGLPHALHHNWVVLALDNLTIGRAGTAPESGTMARVS